MYVVVGAGTEWCTGAGLRVAVRALWRHSVRGEGRPAWLVPKQQLESTLRRFRLGHQMFEQRQTSAGVADHDRAHDGAIIKPQFFVDARIQVRHCKTARRRRIDLATTEQLNATDFELRHGRPARPAGWLCRCEPGRPRL